MEVITMGFDKKAAEEIMEKVNQVDNGIKITNTVFNGLNTISNVYKTISEAADNSKKTQALIEEKRCSFELEKMKIENELRSIENAHEEKIHNDDNKSEEDRLKIYNKHEEIMYQIAVVEKLIDKTFDLVNKLVIENPSNPSLIECVRQLSIAASSLKTNSYLEG